MTYGYGEKFGDSIPKAFPDLSKEVGSSFQKLSHFIVLFLVENWTFKNSGFN